MTHADTRRLRDPVHGLIVFEGKNKLDMAAWQLINTAEFQRLRRIKQLGFSEFVFPGATHTRFAHCIGVFHIARQLVRVIERESGKKSDTTRAKVAMLAALLHDLGHGPFSHVFEEVEKSRKIKKKHEKWTAEIILNPRGQIRPILDKFGKTIAEAVAGLLQSEVPIDIYHAIVSSSFDADRLDYLRRDRMMTGSGAGAIDFDWLLDNVRIAKINIGADEAGGKPVFRETFCINCKALQAAETFLLARYHLYEQVYFHKTTRGVELLLGAALRTLAELVKKGKIEATGLPETHPLILYYSSGGNPVKKYLALDDTVIWGGLELMSHASDKYLKDMAQRILQRKLFKCIDVATHANSSGADTLEIVANLKHSYKAGLGRKVLFDAPKLSLYGEVGADEEKVHKRLTIQLAKDKRREITDVSDTVKALGSPKEISRFYFSDQTALKTAIKKLKS